MARWPRRQKMKGGRDSSSCRGGCNHQHGRQGHNVLSACPCVRCRHHSGLSRSRSQAHTRHSLLSGSQRARETRGVSGRPVNVHDFRVGRGACGGVGAPGGRGRVRLARPHCRRRDRGRAVAQHGSCRRAAARQGSCGAAPVQQAARAARKAPFASAGPPRALAAPIVAFSNDPTFAADARPCCHPCAPASLPSRVGVGCCSGRGVAAGACTHADGAPAGRGAPPGLTLCAAACRLLRRLPRVRRCCCCCWRWSLLLQ